MKRRIKIDGIILFCIFWSLIIFRDIIFRDKPADGILEISVCGLGIVFFLSGQIIRISARGFKSENSRNGALLIENGPYSFVRNPMYLGVILITGGAALILLNPWSACILLAFFLFRYLEVIRREEKKLAAIFARQYYDYRTKVPRILPSIGILFKRDIGEYLPLKISWVKRELGAVVTLSSVILFLLARQGRDARGFGLSRQEILAAVLTAVLFVYWVVYLIRRTKKSAANKI